MNSFSFFPLANFRTSHIFLLLLLKLACSLFLCIPMRSHCVHKRRKRPGIVMSIDHDRAGIIYPGFILLLLIDAGHSFEQISGILFRLGRINIISAVVGPFVRFTTVSQEVVKRLFNTCSIVALVVEEINALGIWPSLAIAMFILLRICFTFRIAFTYLLFNILFFTPSKVIFTGIIYPSWSKVILSMQVSL